MQTNSIVPSMKTTEQPRPASASITVTMRRDGSSMRCRVESLAYFTAHLFRAHAVLEHHTPILFDRVWILELPHLPPDVYCYAQQDQEMIAVFGAFPLVGAVEVA